MRKLAETWWLAMATVVLKAINRMTPDRFTTVHIVHHDGIMNVVSNENPILVRALCLHVAHHYDTNTPDGIVQESKGLV
jgi:hypothetical protein